MNLAEELRASLLGASASGNLEIRESGSRLTAVEPVSWGMQLSFAGN